MVRIQKPQYYNGPSFINFSKFMNVEISSDSIKVAYCGITMSFE